MPGITDSEKARIHDRIVELAGDPDALRDFLADEVDKMTPEERADLEGVARSATASAATSKVAWPQESIDAIWDALEEEVFPVTDVDEDRQQILEAATQAQVQGQELTPEQSAVAEEAAVTEAEEQNVIDEKWNQRRWVLEALGIPMPVQTPGSTEPPPDPFDVAFTDEDKQQILDWMEIFYGQHFSAWEELVNSGYLDSPTKENQLLINAAVKDEEPQQAFEVEVPGYTTQFIRARDLVGASAFGADAKQVSTYVKLAALSGMMGGDGETLVWQPLMALANATGARRKLDEAKANVADRVKQMKADAAAKAVIGVAQEAFDRADQADNPYEGDKNFTWDVEQPEGHDWLEHMLDDNVAANEAAYANAGTFMPSDPLGAGNVGGQSDSIRQLGKRYNEGLEQYADAGLAFVHAVDPELAQRMAWAYENDGKVTDADQGAALRIIANAGFNTSQELGEALLSAGYVEANAFKFFGRGGDMFDIDDILDSEREERTITMPDPEAVRQNVKSLYQQLFLTDPSEDQISQFATQVTGIMVANQKREDVNQETNDLAQLQALFEDTGLYKQLYSHKPGGMSELDYSNMFRVGAQSMLGSEGVASTDALRAGMQTGDVQTTLGAIMGNEESWDNSTFMGRFARAARSVSDMT